MIDFKQVYTFESGLLLLESVFEFKATPGAGELTIGRTQSGQVAVILNHSSAHPKWKWWEQGRILSSSSFSYHPKQMEHLVSSFCIITACSGLSGLTYLKVSSEMYETFQTFSRASWVAGAALELFPFWSKIFKLKNLCRIKMIQGKQAINPKIRKTGATKYMK